MSTILNFGKYKNKDIEEVFKSDISYCQWVFKQPLLQNYPDIYDFLKKKFINPNDYYLNFGKYKGKSIYWIKSRDEGYIRYLRGNEYVQTKLRDLARIVNNMEINN